MMAKDLIGLIWSSEVIDDIKSRLLSSYPDKVVILDNQNFFLLSDYNTFPFHLVFDEKKSSLFYGRLFDKESYTEFNEGKIKLLINGGTSNFSRDFWGSYICIESNLVDDRISVKRDLTGHVPFFYKFINKNMLFSTKISLLNKYLSSEININLDYIISYIIHGNLGSSYTPFINVCELPVGCQLIYQPKMNLKNLLINWDPLNSVSTSLTCAELQEQIIPLLRRIIQSWSMPYESIFLDFSGGIDSTTLLLITNQFTKYSKKITAVNIFHPNIESSNELLYARKIANKANIELVEFDLSEYLPFTPLDIHGYKPDKPALILTNLKQEIQLQKLLKLNTKALVMWGHGGDHVFMCPPSLKSLADSVIMLGLKNVYSKMSELSMYYRFSLFPLILITVHHLLDYLFNKPYRQKIKNISIAPWYPVEMIENFKFNKFLHPFFYKPKRIAPGKLEHIEDIYSALAAANLTMGSKFCPFLSQPLIELAIGIKTYDFYNEEFDRYPLRKAVSNNFKSKSIWRKDKGEISGIIQLGLKKNRDYLFDMCLNGELAKNQLINKAELEQHIKILSSGVTDHQFPILQLISAEIFMSLWKDY